MNLLRALFDPNFLMSGVAILRDIPRVLRLKQVDGSLFFTEEKRQEYRHRVESVTPQSPRRWGTMEVDQMLHHLNLACGGSLGFYNLPDGSYLSAPNTRKVDYCRLASGAARGSPPPYRLQDPAFAEV
jgi:hypothetical protein